MSGEQGVFDIRSLFPLIGSDFEKPLCRGAFPNRGALVE